MTALILDAGAFVAIERNDRASIARLAAAHQHGMALRSNPIVLAQVWRDGHGCQAGLARFLRAVDVRVLTEQDGRSAGALLGKNGTSDPIDATVVLMAEPGDRIMTSDPDIRQLAETAGKTVVIIPC